MSGKLIVTIDVEDWFQVENLRCLYPPNTWNEQSYRVELNTQRLLQLLDEFQVKATFFVLGGIAEKFPKMVKNIVRNGHEVASHGYGHIMLTQLTEDQIYDDLKLSKAILEDITGNQVKGYRAPSFSITDQTYFILKDLGYEYDSSLHLFKGHSRYGKVDLCDFETISDTVFRHKSGITEYLIPLLDFYGKKIPWGGGGYFRLIPYGLYSQGVKKFMRRNNNFVFYLHPWEIDDDQPKVSSHSIGHLNHFRHYYGLSNTYKKLSHLFSDFEGGRLD